MALLVAYAEGEVVDWRCVAIYLDQAFYEAIFHLCSVSTSKPVLATIARLGYGDELLLSLDEIEMLRRELAQMEDVLLHNQLDELQAVLGSSVDRRRSLGVAGDMHPVLSVGNKNLRGAN